MLLLQQQGIKGYSCKKSGHRASECFWRVQDRNTRKNSCYRCGIIGHTLMQWKEGNRLACGGAGARERASKVACAVLVRIFNIAENGKLEKNEITFAKTRKTLIRNQKNILS